MTYNRLDIENRLADLMCIPEDALRDRQSFIDTVRSGVSGVALRAMMELFNNEELYGKALGVDKKNLGILCGSKSIDSRLSETILDSARVYLLAVEVFGSEEKAKSWFSSKLQIFGESMPIELFDTSEGRLWVEGIITSIDHGEFS